MQLLGDVTSPMSKWGPALEEDRGERYKRPTDIGLPYTISTGHIDKHNTELELDDKNNTELELDNLGYTEDETVKENGIIKTENGTVMWETEFSNDESVTFGDGCIHLHRDLQYLLPSWKLHQT